jgi:hypothetical protein
MEGDEWVVSTDPTRMLDILGRRFRPSRRKSLLFTVAIWRRLWNLLTDHRLEEAVKTAELFADGRCDEDALEFARADLRRLQVDLCDWSSACKFGLVWLLMRDPAFPQEAIESAQHARSAARSYSLSRSHKKPCDTVEQEAQTAILRDIFGNPFLPATFDPDWRTSTAVALAQQMYDSRDFSAMPILADELQDAGCDSTEILDHCRGAGPHVRGCWVVDLVLGKS